MDRLKEMLSNINPKVFWVGAVVVILFVFLRRRTATTAVSGGVVETTQDLGTAGTSGGGMAAGTESTISTLAQTNASIISSVENLTSSVTGLAGKVSALEQVNATQATQAAKEMASTPNIIGTIYDDKLDDATQFYEVSKNLSTPQKESVLSQIAGMGNSGVAVSGATYLTPDQVKKDSNLLASELTRTNAVIANRKAAGQDTTLQEKYLASLKK